MQASDDPQRYEAAICDHARAITRADAVHRAWAAEGSPVTAAGGSTGHALFAGTVRQVATHVDQPAGEVNIAPAQRSKLAHPQARESGQHDDRADLIARVSSHLEHLGRREHRELHSALHLHSLDGGGGVTSAQRRRTQ